MRFHARARKSEGIRLNSSPVMGWDGMYLLKGWGWGVCRAGLLRWRPEHPYLEVWLCFGDLSTSLSCTRCRESSFVLASEGSAVLEVSMGAASALPWMSPHRHTGTGLLAAFPAVSGIEGSGI